MAITLVQAITSTNSGAATLTATFASPVTSGNMIVACCYAVGNTTPISTVTDNVNAGSYANDGPYIVDLNVGGGSAIYSKSNVLSGSTTVTLTCGAANSGLGLTIFELAGAATSSAFDATNNHVPGTGVASSASCSLTTSAANDCIVVTGSMYTSSYVVSAGTNFTLQQQQAVGSVGHYDEYWLDAGVAGSKTAAMSNSGGSGGQYPTLLAVAYKVAASATPIGMFGGN